MKTALLLLSLFLSSAEAKVSYPCDTTYKELNIPYVKTDSLEGYYYCFGLNHGRDRAWEMDYFRRVGEGRNAEVLGYIQLKSDLMMRLLDLPSQAERLWNNFPPEKKKWLELYAEGVNEGFKTGKDSAEFIDLGYSPEPWEGKHTLLVLLLQSFDQTRKTFIKDYDEEKLKAKWGKQADSLFNDDQMPWESNILKAGEYQKKKSSVVKVEYHESKARLWGEFPTLFGLESGSNNWVVSKSKSKSGKAILANDPHLDLKTPMFWYWINIKTPEVTVMGASVPGVPVVVSGTNGKVSWGLTNSYFNTADAVFIKDIKEEQIETIRPLVKIKFWIFKIPFIFKSFEKLKSGHRVLPLEINSEDKMVLRWTGFNLTPVEIYSMFDLFQVQTVTEMDNALSKIGIPSWNFVFADSKGDIGYRMVGKTFKHQEKTPFGISKMSYEELQKEEYLRPEERPHVLKPSRQYVHSANNRHWPSDASFYGGRGYSHSFRAFRIDELLTGTQDVQNFKNIQCDNQVVDAKFFVDKILKNISIPQFQSWNFMADDQSNALPVYRRLMDLMFEKWEVNEYGLYRLLDVLTAEQKNEMRQMHQQTLAEINGRNWGQIHQVDFAHMSKNVSWKFAQILPGVGDTHTVNPGTAKWNPDLQIFEQYSGASMRMIIEMNQTPRLWLALPGLNRNYHLKPDISPWEAWRNCQYTELKF